MTEYRLWITVPDLPFEDEDRWAPFTRLLEKHWPELGPVFTWDGEGGIVCVLATEAADSVGAAGTAMTAVNTALREVGLDRDLASIEIEWEGHVREPVPA